MNQPAENTEAYQDGILKEIYGSYMDRLTEYRFAAEIAYNYGLLRIDTPVIDIGCRNPYLGMLRFLRGWRWVGKYVGIDMDVPEDVAEQAENDPRAAVHQMNVDGIALPFPPTRENPIKLFAVAFVIETLEHMKNRARLLTELQRISASVVVIAPNAEFTGYYPENPFHQRDLTVLELEAFGFQNAGVVNFNGRDEDGELFPQKNGDPKTSSEVWGAWTDAEARRRGFGRARKPKVFEMREVDRGDGRVTLEEMGDPAARPDIVYFDPKTGRTL
jgi:hypothetical protein